MAMQITHIVTADKLFDNYFRHFNKKEFYIGTVFPDIRYLGDVSRHETHNYELCLHDVIQETDSFVAGMKFHSLIDLVREDFVSQEGIYELFEADTDKYSVPKLLEDELLYSKVNDWSAVAAFLTDILPQEASYPIPHDNLEKWHINIHRYVAQPPTDETRYAYAHNLGLPEERIVVLLDSLAVLRDQPRAHEITDDFYARLEELVEKW